MIVCKQCGHHNEEGDTFCGSCGAFLEWVGEKVDEDEEEPEPVEAAVAEEHKHGLLSRIKEKIAGEDDDDVPGATEDPGAGTNLPPDQRQAEVAAPPAPLVAVAEVVAPPEAPAAVPPLAAPPTVRPGAVPSGLAAPVAAEAGLVPPPPTVGHAAPGGATPPAAPAGRATLPPPPAASPEELARQAEAHRQAEVEAKRQADDEARRQAEQARREAEEEARRKEEESRRRAALLVAKPKVVETPEQAKATTVAAVSTTDKKAKGKGKGEAPAVATATAESSVPSAQQPGAQQPGTVAKARPKAAKEAPSRAIKPGDLVCGDCGEGNDPGRKFCRRCGGTLVDAPVAKKPGFFKRLFTREPKAAPEAGSRPGRAGGGGGGGKGGDLKRSGRQAKGKFLGVFANARQFVAVLAIFGIGIGFVIPNVRSRMLDLMNGGIGSVRDIVSPRFSTVFVDQAQSIASSETPGAAAALASNNIKNDHWSPAPTDPAPQLQLRFEDPTNLNILFVYSGNQDDPKNFAANPRPKDIFVTLIDSKLDKVQKQIRLDDTDKAQKFDLVGKDVETVIVDIQSCYPDSQNRSCAIAELEFQRKK